MWEFLGIIFQQFIHTFLWGFIGYIGMLLLLYILYKGKVIRKNNFFRSVKKWMYYFLLPVLVGAICWFVAATRMAEKQTISLITYSIDEAENSVFHHFLKESLASAVTWGDSALVSKQLLVTNYMSQQGIEKESVAGKALAWTANKGLDYLKQTAIENGTITLNDQSINYVTLIETYLASKSSPTSVVLSQSKNLSINLVNNYVTILYTLYFTVGFGILLLLFLEIYFSQKTDKKKSFMKHEALFRINLA